MVKQVVFRCVRAQIVQQFFYEFTVESHYNNLYADFYVRILDEDIYNRESSDLNQLCAFRCIVLIIAMRWAIPQDTIAYACNQ